MKRRNKLTATIQFQFRRLLRVSHRADSASFVIVVDRRATRVRSARKKITSLDRNGHLKNCRTIYRAFRNGDDVSLLGDDTQSQMTGQDNASQSGSTRGARNATGWSSFQLSLHNSAANDVAEKMKNYIILDNGSSMSIFMNPDLVQNIREEEETLELVTNTGTMLNKKKADVPEFGTVWFDDRAIANIFGLCDLKKKYRVTYDSEIEDAFIVHDKEKGNIKFSCTEEGLYAFTPSESYRKNLNKNETTLATDCPYCIGRRKQKRLH